MKKENTQTKLQERLKQYSRSAKAMKKQVKAGAALTLPLGAAFLAANPIAEGAVVYSGVQNVAVNAGSGYIGVDIDGGGADISFKCDNNPNFFAQQQNQFSSGHGFVNGSGYFYFNNVSSNASICPPLGGFVNTNGASFSYKGSGPFSGFTLGDQGFIGFKLTGNRYGWARLEKGTVNNWIVVDWAYETTANTCIVPAISLPVELISFETKVHDSKISLIWQTSSEINNAGFEVERSTDGKNFENLTFVEGQGTTFEQQDYLFDDKTLRSGQLYYYRLKQIDFDGNFEYSKVITAQLEGDGISGIFSPNPSNDGNTRLSYNAGQEGQLTLRVFDVAGKELLNQTHEVNEGNNQLDLNFGDLGNGTYFVKMEQGSRSTYQKLIMNFN